MTVEQFQMTFIGMEPSEAIKNYALEKFGKHDFYLAKSVSGSLVFKQNVHNRGVSHDFFIEVDVHVPKTVIHVDQEGDDVYALIDKVSDLLQRNLQKHFEKSNPYEG